MSVILAPFYLVLSVAGLVLVAIGGRKNVRVLGWFPRRTAPVAKPWVFGGLALMAAGIALLLFAPV
jgi:hypothetical protein